MNFRAILDKQKMTIFQWTVVVMTTLMNFLDGFDVLSMAFTASNIQADLNLSKVELGSLFSAALMGMTCGSIFLAFLADKYGRRPVLLSFLSLSSITMILTTFASHFYMLLVLRFITGLGVGTVLVVATSITGEFANKKYKALAISIYTAGFSLGATFAGIISGYLQTHFTWHSVFFVGGLIAFISVVIFFFVLPESVDYLISSEKHNKKLDTLAQKLQLPKSSLFQAHQAVLKESKFAIIDVFSKEYRISTIAIWACFFVAMFCFYFVTPWTPVVLKDAGMKGSQSIIVGYMITFGGVLGCLVYGLVATKIPARLLMIIIMISAVVCVLGFVYSVALSSLIFFGVFIGFWLNAIISGVYSIVPTLYRSNIRNSAIGYTVGVGRFGAICAPIVAGFLLQFGFDKQSLYLVLVLVLGVGILAASQLKERL